MNIEPHELTVRELVEGYSDDGDGGVRGYDGKLDIRPAFQREFVYDEKDRAAVIDTVSKGYPLNVMYWAVRDDGTFEVIDGQQRTISLCQFATGVFSFEKLYFANLQQDKRDQILDYKVTVYFCSGTPSERLGWFETINIAGKTLTKQELRNAVYSGPWVADAKKNFSKRGGPAYAIASNLMSGDLIRQEYLETALKWINGDVEDYMSKHQHDANANELWLYFQQVIAWVRSIFPSWRKEMKGQPWGNFYNVFGKTKLDTTELEARVDALMLDDEIENKRGIYEYVLDGQERHLNLRVFNDKQKREAYERQKGICLKCGEHFEFEGMEGDHITPWHEGGRTIATNCQMLCIFDNRSKGSK